MFGLKRFLYEEEASGAVELILILVVLVALVVLFKDKIQALVNDMFAQISTNGSTIKENFK